MKKLSVALIIALMTMVLSFNVGAANYNAFSGEIKTNSKTECHDAGGEKEMGWYVDDAKGECFGIGNTEAGDYVVFPQVDFGTTGASKASIRFSFLVTETSPLPCTMEMYVDSVSGTPVATFNIEDTGHWIEEASMNFTSNCNISSGVHDVFVKWKDNTGSLFGISFTKTGSSGSTNTNTSSSSKPSSGSSVSAGTSSNSSSKTESGAQSQTGTDSTDSTVSTDSSQAEVSGDNSNAELTSNNSGSSEKDESTVAAADDSKSNKGLVITVIIIAVVVVAGGVAALIFVNKKKDPAELKENFDDKDEKDK